MGLMATSVLVYISIVSGALAVPKIHPGHDGVHVGVNLNLGDPAKESQVNHNWNHEMENAIKNGDVETAKQLINSGIDVNAYRRPGPLPRPQTFQIGSFTT